MKRSQIFDTESGTLTLANDFEIYKTFTQADLPASGVNVVSEFDLKTGWHHCTGESAVKVADQLKPIYLTFSFENKTLRYLSLKLQEIEYDSSKLTEAEFYERARLTAPNKFQKYAEFLASEIGEPDERDEAHFSVIYRYSWGNISVAYDYHNFACSIGMRWVNQD